MYQPRVYREKTNRERFESHQLVEEESDLWIGFSPGYFKPKYLDGMRAHLKVLRSILKEYIFEYPEFNSSLTPIPVLEHDPDIIERMKLAAVSAGTGPMAAVAGLIAQEMGNFLLESAYNGELIIENGGDIYLSIHKDLIVSIDAGNNRKFSTLGLNIPADLGPLGLCTSSGMFGHSFSMGKADSVCVISKSACLADAWATTIANKIMEEADVEKAISNYNENLLSVVAIKDSKIGLSGHIELVPLK